MTGIEVDETVPSAVMGLRKQGEFDLLVLLHSRGRQYWPRYIRLVFPARRIVGDPREYARKLLHNFQSMLVTGVYAGEFFERPECQPRCFIQYIRTLRELRSDPVTSVRTSNIDDARTLLLVYSWIVGKYEVLFSFMLFPLVAILAWREKNLLLLLVLGGIAYQAALNVLAYHMATYTSNMYFLHLTNVSFGAVWLRRVLSSGERTCPGDNSSNTPSTG